MGFAGKKKDNGRRMTAASLSKDISRLGYEYVQRSKSRAIRLIWAGFSMATCCDVEVTIMKT
jgi:hypothetical protein